VFIAILLSVRFCLLLRVLLVRLAVSVAATEGSVLSLPGFDFPLFALVLRSIVFRSPIFSGRFCFFCCGPVSANDPVSAPRILCPVAQVLIFTESLVFLLPRAVRFQSTARTGLLFRVHRTRLISKRVVRPRFSCRNRHPARPHCDFLSIIFCVRFRLRSENCSVSSLPYRFLLP
jgi:hypothetical protein